MSNLILRAVREHAAAHPARVALEGEDRPLDYATLATRVRALAAWLQAQGVSRAALWGDNSCEWIVADLAAWQAGVTLVPLPTFFSPGQLRHVVATAGLSHVIACGPRQLPLSSVASRPAPVDGVRLVQLEAAATPPPLPPDTCKITFTSGTTGAPKGVCLSSQMLEAVAGALAARIHAGPAVLDVASHFSLLPLGTLLENVAGVYVPLLLGKRVIVRAGASIGLAGSSQLDLPQLLRALHEHQPNSLIVLPQILRALVAAASGGRPPPASLRFVAVGGAHTPGTLIERARAFGIPVYEGYGLSECASVVALNAPGADRPGSVGRVLEHVRLRIEAGSIQVAGNVFPGYVGQPANPGGDWFDTGDLGHLDEAGFLYVTGRRSNVLISSYGRNISPEWVEAELSSCPSIAQVMVVGEAQPCLGAVVVPVPGFDPTALPREIAAANARLPDYARVRRYLVATEPFTVANGSLTQNGRLRREVVAAREGERLAALFEAASPIEEEIVHDVL